MATNRTPTDPVDIAAALFVSAAERGELEGFEVVDGGSEVNAILRNNDPGTLDGKAKAAIIEAVRAGKHAELKVRATTFRQKDGHPNKNALRFKSSQLGAIATSFTSKPFLVDHAKWAQSARKGTILSSEGAPLAGGWFGFRQQLHVVKPDAVISVLDGTIDAFSIGWDPRGEVRCTAHNVDVRSRKSCYWTEGCYPGKLVEVDGEKKIAEYEWQTTEGLEVSGVNSPAVSGTKIENVSQLAAELGLTRPPSPEPRNRPMKRFALLFAALAIPSKRHTELAELDDDKLDARLAEAVTEIRGELTAANEEKAAAITRAETAEKANEGVAGKLARLAELEVKEVDSELEAQGYRAGKLIRAKDKDGKSISSAREARLRRIAKEDGVPAMLSELAEMPVVVPVGKAALSEDDPNPRPPRLAAAGDIPSNVLGSVASQLGLKEDELAEHHNRLSGRDGGGSNN